MVLTFTLHTRHLDAIVFREIGRTWVIPDIPQLPRVSDTKRHGRGLLGVRLSDSIRRHLSHYIVPQEIDKP